LRAVNGRYPATTIGDLISAWCIIEEAVLPTGGRLR
jgi:hypothetical protein